MSSVLHVAAFRVRDGRVETLAIAQGDRPLRCASVLKPLMFWLAGERGDAGAWEQMAAPAVISSANGPMVELWESAGSERLLSGLVGLTGSPWLLDPAGSGSFGSVLTDAAPLAEAYGKLAAAALAEDPAAMRLMDWMTFTPDEMTFGAREAAAGALGVDAEQVAVKAGWDCNADESMLRTHAVTVVGRWPGEAYGSVVLSAVPFEGDERGAYARAYRTGREVLGWHQRAAARLISGASALALDAVTDDL